MNHNNEIQPGMNLRTQTYPRMQHDLRTVVDRYLSEGWNLIRGKTLEVSKDGETRPVELRDRSGRIV